MGLDPLLTNQETFPTIRISTVIGDAKTAGNANYVFPSNSSTFPKAFLLALTPRTRSIPSP